MDKNDSLKRFLTRADNLAMGLNLERLLNEHRKSDRQVDIFAENSKNLVVASAIVQRIRGIRRELLDSFGPAMKRYFTKRLDDELASDKWILYEEKRTWARRYAGTSLTPIRNESLKDLPYLYFTVQRTDNFVNLGISRSEPRDHHANYWSLPQVEAIDSHLQKKGYTTHIWWLRYLSMYDMDEFLLWISHDLDYLISEIGGTLWDLFKETKHMVEEANQAIEESDK